MCSWLERRRVDVHSPGGQHRLAIAVSSCGAAVVDGISDRQDLLRLSDVVMSRTSHRDADANGITELRPRLRRPSVGDLGFGNGALALHSDGAQHARPPGMLVMACMSPASSGGQTVVVDMAAVHDTLASDNPGLLADLYRPVCRFGGADAPLRSVFASVGARVTARWRDDALAVFSHNVAGHLSFLRGVIDRHRVVFGLRRGQALVLSNTRFLHGRTAFDGDRLMLRVVGHGRGDIAHVSGFSASITAAVDYSAVPV